MSLHSWIGKKSEKREGSSFLEVENQAEMGIAYGVLCAGFWGDANFMQKPDCLGRGHDIITHLRAMQIHGSFSGIVYH